MHFIGNRAIILGDGTPEIQLVYSPGYSTLSVFLPIIGLTIAFGAAEYPSRSPVLHWIALTCTGVFAGLSIVGMHYIGNFGISNYQLEYVPRYLAGSIVIAIGDCLVVLILFYTWREKWISDWWKRLLCAIVLAGGVSAMHFTASTNCIYQFKHRNAPAAIHSRDVQVIVAGVLCGTAGIIVLCVLFFTRHRTRLLKAGSKKIMVACAMFDPDGRVLVTTEGALPSREITEKYNHRTFDEDFDTAHPVFQWIFRVTHNWAGVSDLIPKMKSHLGARRDDSEESSRPESAGSSAHYDPESYTDYSIVFRERFCTAAASLATSMNMPVEKIGVLYDRIIETGTLKDDDRTGKRDTLPQDPSELEIALRRSVFGRGQLLFLTRQLDSEQTDKLLNAGFRFASVQHVGRNLAETMQIPLPTLEGHMSNLRRYVENLTTLDKTGTWLSMFAIIPKPNSKGFDVLVKRSDQEQLPDAQIFQYGPLPFQEAFLQRLDGLLASVCITFLENRQGKDTSRTREEGDFAQSILQAMKKLKQQVPTAWFQNARFVGEPVYAHYSHPLSTNSQVSTIYSLVVCADLYTSIEGCSDVVRVPLSFFNTRQQCYTGSPNHLALARDIHQEFGPLLVRTDVKPTNRQEKKFSMHSTRFGASQIRRPSLANSVSEVSDGGYASDTHELVDKPRNQAYQPTGPTTSPMRDNVFGGILVNSETVIKSDTKCDEGADVYTRDLGLRVAVGTSRVEPTFVDQLFAVARESLLPRNG
jgi:NO-binding membrane sensor protein with MHYT domain